MPDDEQVIAQALAAAAEMARRMHDLDLEGQPYASVAMLYSAREAFEKAMGELDAVAGA
jgi:phosphopantetheinyl transferase (holo-ACP synthase)